MHFAIKHFVRRFALWLHQDIECIAKFEHTKGPAFHPSCTFSLDFLLLIQQVSIATRCIVFSLAVVRISTSMLSWIFTHEVLPQKNVYKRT